MGELKRDVTSADEDDPPGKRFKIEEVVARGHEVRTGDVQGAGVRTGGDRDVPGREGVAADRDPVLPGKPGGTVIGMNPRPPETLLLPPGDRVGERALERDQLRPVDRDFAGDPAPREVADARHRRGGTGKHPLRDAAPQGARPPVVPAIGDRDPHPGGPAVPGDVGTGDPGPDNEKIVLPLHSKSPVATERYKGLPGRGGERRPLTRISQR